VEVTEAEGETIVQISGDDEIPNRDLVIEWTTTPSTATSARAWTTTREGIPYALLELNGGPLPDDLELESRDLYVLLDRSGSMSGEPWKAACRAVYAFAKSLPTRTRIDLTLFESSFTHFTQEPVEAATFLAQAGPNSSSLTSLGTAGGTELAPALDAVFARRHRFSADRPAVLLLITDGMVGNERALIQRARKSDTILHLVGIGFAPNDALRSLAEATGGQAVFSPPTDALVQIVTRFSSRLSKPLLENLTLPEGWQADEETNLRTLYPLEQRLLVLRGEPGSPLTALSSIRDRGPVELAITDQPVQNSALPLLWARDRIRVLEREGKSTEALELSREFNLASSQTSFVAWDPEEQVAVASRHLHQPTLDLRKVNNRTLKHIGHVTIDHESKLRSRRHRDVLASIPTDFHQTNALCCSLPHDDDWEEIRATVNQFGTPNSILIMLVHQDQRERRFLRNALEDHHRVMEAANGQEAFDLARSHPVELVLIEPELPAIDGIALIKRLRKDAATIQVPIVFIPGERDQSSGREALKAGASYILDKPSTPADLHLHVTYFLIRLARAYMDAKNSPLTEALAQLAPYEMRLRKEGSYPPVCQVLEDPWLRMRDPMRALKTALPVLLRQRDDLPTAERELFTGLIKDAEREIAKAIAPFKAPQSRVYDDEL
jgi:CheY-like chemotaxis protein